MLRLKIFTKMTILFFIAIAVNYSKAQTPACGSDDRQPSSVSAVGRVVIPYPNSTEYGTAFILKNGKLVTAGHICGHFNLDTYVEFNVPASDATGHPVSASASNKYMVIQPPSSSYHYDPNGNAIPYDDWGVFEVHPNSITGKMPIQRQGFLSVKREFPSTNMNIKAIGYGNDDQQTRNYAQQTEYGLVVGYDNGHQVIHFDNTAKGGLSGGPLIDQNSNYVIGIATGNLCGQYGYNMGSSFLKDLFWNKMGFVDITLAQQLENGNTTGTIDAWLTSSFYTYPSGTVLTFDYGSTHAFRAEQTILNNQKYNNWGGQASVENHLALTLTQNTNLTAHLKTTSTPLTITDKLISQNLSDYGNISFKDPWLIDYADPAYGNNKRNQGMSAPFKSRQSPFSPDYTTGYNGDVYQGVFLGQGIDGYGNWAAPYYSVKASASQTATAHGETVSYAFDRWGGTGVQYQSPDNRETPVVFSSAGAVAEARWQENR